MKLGPLRPFPKSVAKKPKTWYATPFALALGGLECVLAASSIFITLFKASGKCGTLKK